jgi:hypothetical protein
MEQFDIHAVLDMLEDAKERCCTYCGHATLVGGFELDNCTCCGKLLIDRQMRESTCDPTRIDYYDNGLANEYHTFSTQKNDDDDDDYEVIVLSDNEDGEYGEDGEEFIFSEDRPLGKKKKQRTENDLSIESKQKAKAAPLKTTIGASGDVVVEEFERLMGSEGYVIGGKGDGTARKYARYMCMLFDNDIFHTRDDFFKANSRELAHSFYRKLATEKAMHIDCKTSASKLFNNYKHGFDKFVMLAAFASTYKPCTQMPDPISMLQVSIESTNDLSIDDMISIYFE